jgi:hypothetical protein
MEEYKLHFKCPNWLFIGIVLAIGYSIKNISVWVIFVFRNLKDLIFSEVVLFFISILIHIFLNIFSLYVIIASNFKNKYYYIINENGIIIIRLIY